MKRAQRLQSAKHWLLANGGEGLVRRYMRHFGVDEVCALLELNTLGKQIDEARIKKATMAARRRALAKSISRRDGDSPEPSFDSDHYHYYVAGHTSNGFSYGITWEDAEADGLLADS